MDIVDQLSALTKDLTFPSEEDYPVSTLTASLESYPAPLTDASVRALVSSHRKDSVVKQKFADFFDQTIGFGDDDFEQANKFREIRELLSKTTNPTVYRIGGVHCWYLVIGQDYSRWVGIVTQAVET